MNLFKKQRIVSNVKKKGFHLVYTPSVILPCKALSGGEDPAGSALFTHSCQGQRIRL